MTRSDTAAVHAAFVALRDAEETSLIVGFGSHAPTSDTRNGSVSATVTRDGITETAEAVHLVDAILLARAAVEDSIKTRDKALAEESDGKPRRGRAASRSVEA